MSPALARWAVRFAPFAALLGAALLFAAPVAVGPPPVRGQTGQVPTPSLPPFTVTPPVAPTPLPLEQRSGTPGAASLPAGGSATFLDGPAEAGPPTGAARLRVENHGDQIVSTQYDGLTLALFVSDPSIGINADAPGASCGSPRALPNRVLCGPLPGRPEQQVSVTTAVLPLDAVPRSPLYVPLSSRALLAPGTDELAAGSGVVVFLPTFDTPATLGVRNLSQEVGAQIVDDGAVLTVTAPDGYTLITSGILPASAEPALPCRSTGSRPNVVVCEHGSPRAGANLGVVWFTAVPTAAADTAATAVLIPAMDSALLVAGAPPSGAGALVMVQYGDFAGGFESRGFGVDAIALYANWDDAILAVTGPDGFRLSAFGGGCAPAADKGNELRCDLSGTPQRFLSVRAQFTGSGPRPGFGPPPRRPNWLLRLAAAPSALAVGESGHFAGGVFVRNPGEQAGPFDYIFTWGDGTADTGRSADHAYAAPGTYTVTLIALEEGPGIWGTVTTTVTVTAPPGG